jgi:hypothetical protein
MARYSKTLPWGPKKAKRLLKSTTKIRNRNTHYNTANNDKHNILNIIKIINTITSKQIKIM